MQTILLKILLALSVPAFAGLGALILVYSPEAHKAFCTVVM